MARFWLAVKTFFYVLKNGEVPFRVVEKIVEKVVEKEVEKIVEVEVEKVVERVKDSPLPSLFIQSPKWCIYRIFAGDNVEVLETNSCSEASAYITEGREQGKEIVRYFEGKRK